MSVAPTGTSSNPLGAQLLQQLLAGAASSPDAGGTPSLLTALQDGNAQPGSGSAGLLSDLLSFSPAAQQLLQAPPAAAQALAGLLSGSAGSQEAMTQVMGALQQDPQGLAALVDGLQGAGGQAGTSNGTDALLTALVNHQSSASDPAALLTLLEGQNPPSLMSLLGTADPAAL